MALAQCMNCKEKIIEDEESAILKCPYCGSGIIKVLEE
ncbi:DNA-directed RNA polymerase subunit RPC12/RpoP [Virgibacillus natechei]|uniref:DNA-directed RNA polymerase subunit RPC12/RpoP n=1 Tax=Virgibacillus natechei TaxID=1216297 RepID=A0ABS4IKW6_9BACI|nr:DNA-directed RNA polymerase subunit RPC12/RpoP [Virgibacillus natechei]